MTDNRIKNLHYHIRQCENRSMELRDTFPRMSAEFQSIAEHLKNFTRLCLLIDFSETKEHKGEAVRVTRVNKDSFCNFCSDHPTYHYELRSTSKERILVVAICESCLRELTGKVMKDWEAQGKPEETRLSQADFDHMVSRGSY